MSKKINLRDQVDEALAEMGKGKVVRKKKTYGEKYVDSKLKALKRVGKGRK